ncbi:DUF58 domain-containing protein [Candidatus Thiodictyon syntrophicum]|jgi:uncharacterized protein (DUF58 family)|uniref:DUF58 domain-containing protein n=1 Tax=Candidatus Thiodictyon syntrophicum TaxID=1166950 RepID=A0A2K8UFK5_9GAMM|nr:DUF58 domain-containing protein [Candidatus Thiodictyon syntrophicum]AUB84348.1 DUF58 domain-containing protein [Candidatus Thiodictyon syntrophicum]
MHPRPPLIHALAIWTAVGLATVWLPWTWPLWQGLGLLIAALALGDLLALHRLPDPRITRRMGRALPLGAWSQVTLEVANGSDQRLRLSVHDLHPGEFAVRGLPADLDLPARHQGRVDYRLRPPSRGDFPLTGCAVATRSPLGLWRRTRVLPPAQPLRVFPNFAEISRYTLLAASDQLAQLGVRRLRRLGRGAEFHQLREYREGDSLRRIDWKATSRMHKLIAREYQDERDQRLVFLLDCGRRMRHRDQGRGHLDEALNALLLLAYVAVRQGDAVGLMTYGGPQRWFAPRKEPGTVNRLLQGLYDLQPSLEAADPLVAARALLAAMPRRALVVVLTNSRDEDQEGLAQAAQLLRRRHLVVIADLREAALDRALEAPIATLDDALRFHAVHGWLAERQHQQERLRHLGIQVLDLLPAQLPIALVNRYFEIKRAGTL